MFCRSDVLVFLLPTGADLMGASLEGAYLHNADLANADLRNADLSRAYCKGANFTAANLTGANMEGAYLNEVNFTGAEGLTIEMLKSTQTLHSAQFDPELATRVEDALPEKLKKPREGWINNRWEL